MPEQWIYVSSENSVENLLGICSMGMCENRMPELTKAKGLDGSLWKNPIVLGDEWIFSFDKSKITLFVYILLQTTQILLTRKELLLLQQAHLKQFGYQEWEPKLLDMMMNN